MPPKSLKPPLPRNEQKQRSRDRMINILLQGIIAANPHPNPKVTVEARLSRARQALFGEKPAKGRKAIQDELVLFPLIDDALKAQKDVMKRATISRQRPETQAQWLREIAEAEMSMRGIAKKHVSAFAKPMTEQESTQDWIRRTLTKLELTTRDWADLEGIFYGGSASAKLLHRIFHDLRLLGIDSTNPIGTESDIITPKQD